MPGETVSHSKSGERPRRFPAVGKLVDCASAYGGWFKIVFARYGGRRVNLRIRKTQLEISVGPENLAQAVKLAEYLRQLEYEQHDRAIAILLPGGHSELVDPAVAVRDRAALNWIGWLAAAARSGFTFSLDGGAMTVEADGLRWFVRRGSEDLRLGPLLGHTFEKHEYAEWFSKIVGPGSVFVDVGANVGGYALRAARLGAKVYALEPSLGNYLVLKKNAAINRLRPVMYRLAAHSKEGEATLYGKAGAEGKFRLRWFSGSEIAETVRTVTLDSLLMGRLNHVDLLKVDVEGAEFEVLCGSQKLLSITENVMVEVRDTALVGWLKRQGFRLKDVGSSFGEAKNMFFSKNMQQKRDAAQGVREHSPKNLVV